MKKPAKRAFEVIIVISIFVIITATALRPYNMRVFIGSHSPPEPGTSKQAVIQKMGMPTGETKTVPVPASKSNKDSIDNLNNLPVSYILFWRRKPDTLELFFEIKRRPYRTSVVAFDKHDKVINGFWGYSYWPVNSLSRGAKK